MPFEDWFIARARVSARPHRRAKADDKLAFFQQLGTLVSSGTPLLEAIQICANQNQSIVMQQVLVQIAARLAAGCSLHDAAAGHPNVFEHHWIEVIRTGELTGQLGPVLQELNRQVRDTRETRRKVMGALMYPIILVIVSIIALIVMLWFVVPTFTAMFQDMGAELPGITQFVVSMSQFVVRNGIYMVGGLIAIVLLIRRYLKTETGRRRIGGIGLALPLVGELMVQSAMYRFATNVALLLKSGIPLLEALNVLSGVFHRNPVYRDALGRARNRVAAGRPLAPSLEEVGLFTPMMTNMVRIGEESGQLASVMEQIAPYYKEMMESLVAKVTKLMEPVIIIAMGATIAGLLMSIYLPMFDMAGKIH
jgi:type IV pilus assembly protein PilC